MPKVKPVYFADHEADLLALADQIPNWSKWVKEHLARGKQTGLDPELVTYVKRLVEAQMAGRGGTIPTSTGEEARDDDRF